MCIMCAMQFQAANVRCPVCDEIMEFRDLVDNLLKPESMGVLIYICTNDYCKTFNHVYSIDRDKYIDTDVLEIVHGDPTFMYPNILDGKGSFNYG